VTILVAWKAWPILTPPSSWEFVLWYLVAILAAIPLGWLLGGVFLWPFVAMLCNRLNGAPYRKGEHVCVLVGKYRNRITQVYEEWPSRHQVRLDLGEEEKSKVTDVYSYNEVCRVKGPEIQGQPGG
jgi:hypothetical protein